ncbi:beta-ketoacyl-ACP synthase [Moritella yayanosii]|uniref:Putative 3-oxoacyl-[acyl-carrier-protein] synthase II, FabF n=1 Tax=Moritella yayanosii TaxID=69539 RepID=A0A330LRE1_9GAMM|nr:beta-ketoacyl-ACP synthase [Moritella yayanosii]SQD76655.1 putative 3-oxoacyl-[acyl-carrier-protein] synthase II, FabF [Moritella yayanosii]
MRRVVITGMSAITALGDDWPTFKAGLEQGKNVVKVMPEWDYLDGLNTRLAAPVLHFEKPAHYKRKQVRSMGRVSLMSTRATELALEQAQLLDHPALTDGRTGISYGSSVGSTEPLINFSRMMDTGNMSGVTATSYIQTMSHTAPVNVGIFFGLTGRVITTSSACTSGSQGIGYAYEAIKFGRQDLMVAGGAEELCITQAAVFDTLYATSVKNDTPELTPRPFDTDRDGLVIGEGACTLILEELEHALARGAKIYAEIIGFGCNSDGKHVTQPTAATMQIAIEQAVEDANIDIAEIGYVCAHGTATDRGDIAETNATAAALGKKPISSLKSYLGHTLGACGAIEAWASINMMQDNWFAPTLNLDNIAPECGDLDYIRGEGRVIHTDVVMSNNFAFGGINTSLLFKRWS